MKDAEIKVVRMNLTARSMGKLVMSSLDKAELMSENERKGARNTLFSELFNDLTVKMSSNSVEFVFFDDSQPRWIQSWKGEKPQIADALRHICDNVDDPSITKLIGDSYSEDEAVILTTRLFDD